LLALTYALCARGLNHLGWEGWGTDDLNVAEVLIDERAYDLALIEARYAEVVHLARAKGSSLPVILLVDSGEDAQRWFSQVGRCQCRCDRTLAGSARGVDEDGSADRSIMSIRRS